MYKIPEKIDSKFRYVLLSAQRAEQMMRGARPRVESRSKVARTAMDEIRQGLVDWDYGPAPEPEESVEASDEEPEPPADVN